MSDKQAQALADTVKGLTTQLARVAYALEAVVRTPTNVECKLCGAQLNPMGASHCVVCGSVLPSIYPKE
jgi:hypothetical protein